MGWHEGAAPEVCDYFLGFQTVSLGIEENERLHAWHWRVTEAKRTRVAAVWTYPQWGQVQVGADGRVLLRVRMETNCSLTA